MVFTGYNIQAFHGLLIIALELFSFSFLILSFYLWSTMQDFLDFSNPLEPIVSAIEC